MPEDVDLATIPVEDKTLEQKVEAIFTNFKKEELEKFAAALRVLNEHELIFQTTVEELLFEIDHIIRRK